MRKTFVWLWVWSKLNDFFFHGTQFLLQKMTKDNPSWHAGSGLVWKVRIEARGREFNLLSWTVIFSLNLIVPRKLFFLYFSSKASETLPISRRATFKRIQLWLSIIFNPWTFRFIYLKFNYYILITKISWSQLQHHLPLFLLTSFIIISVLGSLPFSLFHSIRTINLFNTCFLHLPI